MNSGIYGISLFDSLVFSIKDDSGKTTIVSQDKPDFDCLIQATKESYNPWDPDSVKNQCTQTNMIIEFGITGGEPTEGEEGDEDEEEDEVEETAEDEEELVEDEDEGERRRLEQE